MTYHVILTIYRADPKALLAHAEGLGGSLATKTGGIAEYVFPTKQSAQAFESYARLADARHVSMEWHA